MNPKTIVKRSGLGLRLCILGLVALQCVALCGIGRAQQPAQAGATGVLLQSIPVPLKMGDKVVGSATLPKGTGVRISEINGDTVLVEAPAGTAWTSKANVAINPPLLAAAPTPAPKVTLPPVATPPKAASNPLLGANPEKPKSDIQILIGFPETVHNDRFPMYWMFKSIEDATGLPTKGKKNGPPREDALENVDVFCIQALGTVKGITTPEGFEKFLKTKGKLLVVGYFHDNVNALRKNGLNLGSSPGNSKQTNADTFPRIHSASNGCDIIAWAPSDSSQEAFTKRVVPLIKRWVSMHRPGSSLGGVDSHALFEKPKG